MRLTFVQCRSALPVVALLSLAFPAASQTATAEAAVAPAVVVPQMMKYSGVAANRAGDTVEAVFRIYSAKEGGEPLWSETQQVTVDRDGKYAALLGAATEGGLPQAVFAAARRAGWASASSARRRSRASLWPRWPTP